MSVSKFLRIGDKFVKVSLKEGKLDFTEVTAADQIATESFEAAVLSGIDPSQSQFATIFEKIRDEMIASLSQNIKKVVLQDLGFRDSWGTWEVDRSNGKMTMLTEHVKTDVARFLKEHAFQDAITLTDEEKETLHAAYRKEFLNSYQSQLQWNLRDMVAKVAQADAKALGESLVKERTDIIGKMLLDTLFSKDSEKKD